MRGRLRSVPEAVHQGGWCRRLVVICLALGATLGVGVSAASATVPALRQHLRALDDALARDTARAKAGLHLITSSASDVATQQGLRDVFRELERDTASSNFPRPNEVFGGALFFEMLGDFPDLFSDSSTRPDFRVHYRLLYCIDERLVNAIDAAKRDTGSSAHVAKNKRRIEDAFKQANDCARGLRFSVPESQSQIRARLTGISDQVAAAEAEIRQMGESAFRRMGRHRVAELAQTIENAKLSMMEHLYPAVFFGLLPFIDVFKDLALVEINLKGVTADAHAASRHIPGGAKKTTKPATKAKKFKSQKRALLRILDQLDRAIKAKQHFENSVTEICTPGKAGDAHIAAGACVTLTVTKSGTGTGKVTGDPASGIHCGAKCTVTLPAGTFVSLVGTPDAGSVFDGWSGGGCTATQTSCGFTLNANTTVDAKFNKPQTPNCTDHALRSNIVSGTASDLYIDFTCPKKATALDVTVTGYTIGGGQPPASMSCNVVSNSVHCTGSAPPNSTQYLHLQNMSPRLPPGVRVQVKVTFADGTSDTQTITAP